MGKNISTSWASLGVRAILVFLVNPYIIHTLGNDRYGVWVLAVSIINYMTILDLGLKQALIRFISKFLGLGEYDKINALLNTGFIIYSLVSLAVIGLTLILSFFALDWFKIPSDLVWQGRVVLFLVGINTALNFGLLCWGDSHGAFHRFDITYGLMIAEDILRTGAIIILFKSGYGLIPFALCYVVFGFLKMIAGAVILRRIRPEIRINPRLANRETFRTLVNYGFISFLISIAWLLIANTDNVLIGYFLDASSVTMYAIAAGFIVYLRSFVLAVSFPLRPMISHYEALNKKDNIRFIYTRGTKYLYFATFMVAGGLMVFGGPMIKLWMGPGYDQSAMILRILILPAAAFLPQSIANSIMYGVEKHKYLLYVIIAEGIFNLVLSIILVRYYELAGVAYGTAIPQVIIYVIAVPVMIKMILDINLAAFYRNMLKASLTALAVSFLISRFLCFLKPPENWAVFFAEIAAVGMAGVLAAGLIFDREEIRTIISRLSGKA
nr:oligosaccharide flippase family protein [candidate division Zixibacteria bacterium]